jgi:hypothetical protein
MGNGFGPGMSSNGFAKSHSSGLACATAAVLLHLLNTSALTLRNTSGWLFAVREQLNRMHLHIISRTLTVKTELLLFLNWLESAFFLSVGKEP